METTSRESNESNEGINMSHRQDKSSVSQKNYEYFTTAIHVLIIGFVLFILYLCLSNELILFTWHPILLACGWMFLMAEGILMLTSNNILSKQLSLSHKSKVKYHWIIQAVGVSWSIIGFAIIYINKNLHNKLHFHSWHGLIGLISIICCIPACTTGIIALYNFSFNGYLKPINCKLIHRICGILTFLVGSTTILLSLYTKWFERNVNELLTLLWFILILIIVISTVLQGSIKVFNRLKSIWSNLNYNTL